MIWLYSFGLLNSLLKNLKILVNNFTDLRFLKIDGCLFPFHSSDIAFCLCAMNKLVVLSIIGLWTKKINST